jgi:hypothetical protein
VLVFLLMLVSVGDQNTSCQGDNSMEKCSRPIAGLELRDTFHTVEMLEGDSILN